MNLNLSAKTLLHCIGEISDVFVEEAETADVASLLATRKRLAKIGAAAAIASVGLVLFSFVRSRKGKRMVA